MDTDFAADLIPPAAVHLGLRTFQLIISLTPRFSEMPLGSYDIRTALAAYVPLKRQNR
jgi:hypothetical protein